jgi:hypothetical protein
LTQLVSRLAIKDAVLHHQLYSAQSFDVLSWIALDTNKVRQKAWFDGTQTVVEP